MSALTGNQIQNTYQGLVHLANSTTGVTSVTQSLQDGLGNNLPIQVSNNTVNISGSLLVNGLPIEFTNTGSFATTGSNVFLGNQTVTGSVYLSGAGVNYYLNGTPISVGVGSSGTSGTSGSSGVNGTSGTSGSSGTSPAGFSSGTSGTSGVNGSSGTSGVNGSSGTSGTSGSNGSSGTSGTAGTSGTSGSSPLYSGTSTSSFTLQTGCCYSFTTQTGLAFAVGQPIRIFNSVSNYANANVTSYNSGTGALLVDVVSIVGSGTFTSWTISLAGASGTNGTSGTSGNSGSSGTSGSNGSSGTSGTSGSDGSSGTSGTSGATGSSGTSGTSGAGIFTQTGSFFATTNDLQVTGSLIVTGGITGSITDADNARDIVLYVKNTTGVQIDKGKVVRITGSTGDNALIALADWTDDNNSANTLGFVNDNIANDAFGYVTTNGTFIGLNTSGMTAGDMLYLSSSGNFTNVIPPPPYHEVRLGQVLRPQQNNGSAYVSVINGFELTELHDVDITNPVVGDLLVYRSGSYGQWVNETGAELGFATTGSNSFVGNQTITGSLIVSSSVGVQSTKYSSIDGQTLSIETNGAAGIDISSAMSLPIKLINPGGQIQITGSVNISGSNNIDLIVTGSARFTTPDGVATNTIAPNQVGIMTATGTDDAYTQIFASTSSNAGMYLGVYDDPNFNTDVEFAAIVTSGGTTFNDWDNGVTFGYVPWMSVAPNTGNNPAPQFKRSVGVTGSITGSNDILINSLTIGRGGGNSITNTVLGSNALKNNVTGTNNIAIGSGSLTGLISGSNNVAVGLSTLTILSGSNPQAQQNVVIGNLAGSSISNGTRNTAIGHSALSNGNNINRNTVIGRGALQSLGGGAAGYGSGSQYNTVIGHNTAFSLFSGSQNTIVNGGSNGGEALQTGSNNTVLGAIALPVNLNNSTIIGLISNAATIGTSPVTNSVIIADGEGNVMVRKDGSSSTVQFPTSVNITGSLTVNGSPVGGGDRNGLITTGSLGTTQSITGSLIISGSGGQANLKVQSGTGVGRISIDSSDWLYRDFNNFNTVMGGALGVQNGFTGTNNMIMNGAFFSFTTGSNNTIVVGGGGTFSSGSSNTIIGQGTNNLASGSNNVLIGNFQTSTYMDNHFVVGVGSNTNMLFKSGSDDLSINTPVQITGSLRTTSNIIASGSILTTNRVISTLTTIDATTTNSASLDLRNGNCFYIDDDNTPTGLYIDATNHIDGQQVTVLINCSTDNQSLSSNGTVEFATGGTLTPLDSGVNVLNGCTYNGVLYLGVNTAS